MSEPISKTKRIIFVYLTFLISVIIFFAIGEVIFRMTRGAPVPLEEIIQKKETTLLEPNAVLHNFSSKEGEFSAVAHVNSFGYRGKEFAKEKSPGVKRIMAVGDSFTFGVGAEDHETIPARLEEYLNQKGVRAEVINAGAGHLSPVKHFVNLRDIHLQYRPDMVVLLFDLTDLWDDWHWERAAIKDKNGEIKRFDLMYKYGKRDWWRTFHNFSAFGKWIDRKIVRVIKQIVQLGITEYIRAQKSGMRMKAYIATSKNRNIKDVKTEYDGLLFMRGRDEEELIREHFKRTERYLLKIKELCARHNIPLVLGMYPHGIYISKNQWREGRVYWGFEDKKYTDYLAFELMEEFAREAGIPFINALPAFLSEEEGNFFFDHDGYMTPEGNTIMARAIAEDPVIQQFLE